MQIYALDADTGFAAALSTALAVAISPHEARAFEDGEHKLRPLQDPRGSDAYVISSLYGDAQHGPQDKLLRLLLFIATLREHGAARVTAVLPYLAFARKDRQTKPFDPVTSRYVAQLFEAVGTAQCIVLETHNLAAFQNAFRCPAIHIEAHRAFQGVALEWVGQGPMAVASPDPGGVKRAQLWRESLESALARPLGFAMVDKRRSQDIVSSQSLVAGDVRGMVVLLIDDLIASGGTLRHAARAMLRAGAREVVACAAHGLFTGDAAQTLADEAIARVIVTDSVPLCRVPATGQLRDKLVVASAAGVFAQALMASHHAWRR
jgi:ribose-phosphate pyrophosphokinase